MGACAREIMCPMEQVHDLQWRAEFWIEATQRKCGPISIPNQDIELHSATQPDVFRHAQLSLALVLPVERVQKDGSHRLALSDGHTGPQPDCLNMSV